MNRRKTIQHKRVPYVVSPKVSGINYVIFNNKDIIQKTLLEGRQWNSDVVNLVRAYILTNNLKHFVNIGSHIGSISLPISLCIDKVTAIEAYPPTYNHLCQNIKVNRLSNVFAYNVAVGNSNEDVYFMSDKKVCPVEGVCRVLNNTGGMHAFTQNDIDNNIRSGNLSDMEIKNKVVRFDEMPIDNFDIMLVDIEGFEYDFLLGAKEKLIKNKPILVIEIWDNAKRRRENMRQSQEDVINFIKSLGYELRQNIGVDYIFSF